jgi:hypothetical protein
MKGRKRLTAFILALLLVCLAAVPAENACAASLTELRTEVVELNDQLTLVKNINYNSSYGDNDVEHYFEYTPGGNVLPLVCYGSGIKGAVSASRVFSEEAENGVTVAGLTNGDFFVMATGVSLGPVIRDGVIRTGGYSESIIAFKEDGTAKIGDPSLNIRLSFVDKDIHYGKLNFNKSVTETNGICAYTSDFGETNSATLDTFNVFVRVMDGSSKVGDTIVGVVESSLDATGKTKLPENYLVLSIAKDTPYATALSQMQSLEPGEQVTLEFMGADDYLDTWQALGFEKWLVKGGQPVSGLDASTAAPRTAFGLKPDGSYIVYTVDGRQAGYSAGLTYLDLAQRMAELGCIQAVNLDGGASTQLFAVYPGFDKQMQINRDSDATYLRSCANYVCFANFNEKTGVPAHLHVYPFDEYVLCGTQLPVYAKATDSGWFTCDVPEDIAFSCDDMGTVEEDVYTAGSKPGTGIITASSGDLSGTMRVYLVADPDSITASVDGKAKTLLKAGLDKSYRLTAKSTWRGQELRSTQGCYTWTVEGDIGTIDENGVFTAAGEHGNTGTITVTAGKTKQTIAVTLQQTLPAADLQEWIREIVQNLDE